MIKKGAQMLLIPLATFRFR